MKIRRAEELDITGINQLLRQVLMVHYNGRPDLFKENAKKYTDEQLIEILKDEKKPVFVAVDDQERVLGYAFCVHLQHRNDNILTDIQTLYLDDLCVEEGCRGQHIGTKLYEYVCAYAKEKGCYNVTLNVWACNESAIQFYQTCGLNVQKIGMEKIIEDEK